MVHSVDLHVGQRLKQARKMRRMSLSSVAEKMGLSFQQIQKYETGANRISASCLFELSQVLDVPTAFFFAGVERKDPTHKMLDEQIEKALASIEDARLQERIISFIHYVSGTQRGSIQI